MLDAILVQITTSYIHMNARSEEPQLGLYYLAEYAHNKGFDVKIKKYSSAEPIIASLLSLLDFHDCSVLGFYVDSENIWIIRRILFDLKKKSPDLFIIIGGPQVTGDPCKALKRIPNVNCAIIGRGEETFVEILSAKGEQKKRMRNIKGLAFYDGEYVFTGTREYKEIDTYSFPIRHKYTLDKNLTFDQILTGRGCIGHCAFCFEGNKLENNFKSRNTADVIEEIDYLIRNLNGKRFFSFLDDTFIIDPEKIKIICNHLIKKYNGDIKWFCEARADILLRNIELLPLMKKAGLVRIQLGGESGSQKVLNAYRKNIKISELKSVVKAIYDNHIVSVYINFIIGGAFESLNTYNETLELAKELLDIAPCCAEVGCSVFTPYVGTPMYKRPDNFGIKIIDKDLLTGPDGYTPYSETSELTCYKISQLRAIFENEISKKYIEILGKSSYEDILRHYDAVNYGIVTQWYEKCEQIESLKNYFGALNNYGFLPMKRLSLAEIQTCIPYRTCQPVSDGQVFFRKVFLNTYIECSSLEEKVYLLSSGKLSFQEIVFILSKNRDLEKIDSLETEIYNIYKKFDSEFSIIWKCYF